MRPDKSACWARNAEPAPTTTPTNAAIRYKRTVIGIATLINYGGLGSSGVKLHGAVRVPYARQHKVLRFPVGIEPLFRVHAHISRQQFRFAGPALPLPAGERYADSVLLSGIQYRLAPPDDARLARSGELNRYPCFRSLQFWSG